ncbi:DUF167 domain-containing protein [Candidatus Omnitrophota bacterium]
MKVSVRVKPNSRENSIEKIAESGFVIRVKARPEKGRANQAATEMLAGYFCVPKSRVLLLRGRSSRQKLFEIHSR